MLGFLYERACRSIRALGAPGDKLGNIRTLVSNVCSELKQAGPIVQRRCYPILVESLLMQRSRGVGKWADKYYHHMAACEYDLSPEYFRQLLTHSSFTRSFDIPYHDALLQTVKGGLRPNPPIVMNAVENMYPFTDDIRGTFIALQCVVELQTESGRLQREQDEERSQIIQQLEGNSCTDEEREQLEERLRWMRPQDAYIFDISTIEYMAAAAAKKNYVELILLLWDAIDLMRLKPTESVYESTFMCFIKNINLVEDSFIVLKDMEDSGFVPSQALVKNAGFALR